MNPTENLSTEMCPLFTIAQNLGGAGVKYCYKEGCAWYIPATNGTEGCAFRVLALGLGGIEDRLSEIERNGR